MSQRHSEEAARMIRDWIKKVAQGEYVQLWYVKGYIDMAFHAELISADQCKCFHAELTTADQNARQERREERDRRFKEGAAA